jgi:hypothetical protein
VGVSQEADAGYQMLRATAEDSVPIGNSLIISNFHCKAEIIWKDAVLNEGSRVNEASREV